jgi:hypothetical protein
MITGSVSLSLFFYLDACELRDIRVSKCVQYACIVSSPNSHSNIVLSDVQTVVFTDVLWSHDVVSLYGGG